ncbi:MAG TPA: hypothetical protein DDZ76_06770 [Xanthomonadales bacterium]|nr:hypothetical protein [Xanthomonadales bacterium]
MRAALLILLGLIIGSLATLMAINALRQGTPLVDGVMTVTGHQVRSLRAELASGACRAEVAQARLRALRGLAEEFEAALLPSLDDALMHQYIGDYRNTLDTALAEPPGNCAAFQQVLGDLKQRCDFCHRDFR